MAKIDLRKFKKPQTSYLQYTTSENSNQKDQKESNKNNGSDKKVKKKNPEKMGRPFTAEEPLNKKITVNISETEERIFKGKTNGVPLATFVRNLLKKEGII